jgi:hypothetical protein
MTVRWTVRSKNRQKAKKWHFDPKIAILALFSSFQNVACVLFTQTNDWCNNERKKNSKKLVCLDQDSNPGLNFYSKKHWIVDLHSNYGGRSPRPSGRSTPSFLKHHHFDTLLVRTVHCTVVTVQSCSDGVSAQPWI